MLKPLMASRPRLRLAVAESLTGGNLQAFITAESGASDYFVGGVTAYSIDAKARLLRVDRAEAKRCNAVSASIARGMALGVCRLMKANIGVATTGYAEPNRSWKARVPLAHWSVCHLPPRGKPMFIDGYGEFPGASRTEAQARVAEEALADLARLVKSIKRSRR